MQPSGEVGRFEVDDQPSPPADRWRSANNELLMLRMHYRRFQFSIRTLFAVTLVVCLYLGAVPHIQSAREEWRRAQCHNEFQGINIYGLHGVTCPPCRLQMIKAIPDEKLPAEARVAWIEQVAKIANADRQVRNSLTIASRSAAPRVRVAAQAALVRPGTKP